MTKIRKAIVAGVGAGGAAAVAVLAESGWRVDSETVSHALGAFLSAGVLVGWATWRAPNAR